MTGWQKYGAWGAGGLLAGMAAVLWIQPTTPQGTILVIFVFFLGGVVLRGVYSAFAKRNR